MTPIMKRNEKQENAVSPVVGVMLMLVVTIVIAAVVAVFASGVVTTTEAAPVTMLDASIDTAWTGYSSGTGTVVLTSLSGDTIDLSKVKVTITDVSNTSKKFTYEKPIHSFTAGQFLKSGNSVALGYGIDSTQFGIPLSSSTCPVESGKVYNVTVVYDDQHILYDKEVVAV